MDRLSPWAIYSVYPTPWGISLQSIDVAITKVQASRASLLSDVVALEEPLEIRLGFSQQGQRQQRSISITMRTPGHDKELAAGFLFTEGIVSDPGAIEVISACGPDTGAHHGKNVVRVELAPRVEVEMARLERHFYTTSSCGVCGKTSLEALTVKGVVPVPRNTPSISLEMIYTLPEKLRQAQPVFEQTGGLHAAGLFDVKGNLICLREDVGRHNAVDKVVGSLFLEGKIPLHQNVLLVSGRASFELLQKAVVAGIPVLAAVGAPSSLAVELAKRFEMTLLGFLRDSKFNVYSGEWRVEGL